jgi:hypothetical protein
MVEQYSGLDWNALLQKAEEVVTKFEEVYQIPKGPHPVLCQICGHDIMECLANDRQCCEINSSHKEEDFYAKDTPLTGIEEMSGVSHAYYEKQLEEMGKLLEECEALMAKPGGGPETWTPTGSIVEGKGEEDKCPFCSYTNPDPEAIQSHMVAWHLDKNEKEAKRLEEEIAKLEGGENV